MQEVKERKEISNKDKWDLSSIYKNSNEWQKDLNYIKDEIKLLMLFEGKLNNKKDILDFFVSSDTLYRKLEKLYVYSRLILDQDLSNSKAQNNAYRVENIMTDCATKLAFANPEIMSNSKEFLLALADDKDMKDYSYRLKLIANNLDHRLNKDNEEILAQVDNFAGLFKDTFQMFDNVNIKFEDFVNSKNENVKLSHGIYSYYMYSDNREDRKKAFESMFNAYKNNIDMISLLYKGNVTKNVVKSRIRKFKSAFDRATFSEDVPMSVYETLVKCIHKGLPYLHDYMDYRKKVLGYEQLHMYDMHTAIVPDCDICVSYKEATKIVKEALKPMGKEYADLLNKAFSSRWIDVYENKGKRSGAYSWGCYDSHPYVLLNYTETTNDIFTIAHELGHALHSHYSNNALPYSLAGYEIFVAEVASTVNETLLLKYLLKKAKSNNEKKYYLAHFLDMFRTTVFRQTQFAEFEYKAHDLVEKDKSIDKDVLCDIYYKLNKEYYGDNVVNDELIKYEWARIPHFYNAFYVYKYATGLISAVCIAQNILEKGEVFVEKYKSFLKAGGSMSPIDILKLVDVDLTTKKPYEKAMKVFKDTLDEIKSLD